MGNLVGRCHLSEALDEGVRGKKNKAQKHRCHDRGRGQDHVPHRKGWSARERVKSREQSYSSEPGQRRHESHSGK